MDETSGVYSPWIDWIEAELLRGEGYETPIETITAIVPDSVKMVISKDLAGFPILAPPPAYIIKDRVEKV